MLAGICVQTLAWIDSSWCLHSFDCLLEMDCFHPKVFCFLTTNLTKVDSSKWCCCIVSFSTSNWSISQVIPNKQVVEQMTKNERFSLHQSIKINAVLSLQWLQTHTAYSKFCISQAAWKQLESWGKNKNLQFSNQLN